MSIKLSPTSINTFARCQRLFYYVYIEKRETKPNIHLYKGTFTHKLLENVFLNARYIDISAYAEEQLKTWKPHPSFIKNEADNEFHKKEVSMMLKSFASRFKEKLDMIIFEGKAKDLNHAWNIAKPKLREHKIHDKEENITGIIDSVETDYNENIYLVDYKTSKLYRHTMPEEYFRQLALYAYLYRQEFGDLPAYVAIHYLRYGEVFIVPVSESMITEVLEFVHKMKKHIESTDINDYTPCNMVWCDHCVFDEKQIEL